MRERMPDQQLLAPLDLKHRIPELDGLRGTAIAMVLVFHYLFEPLGVLPNTTRFWSHVQSVGRLSWSGVDLFFVLSGFLIGGILLDARRSSNYFQVFYRRRFFRIVPAYASFLIVAFIIYRFGDARFDAMNHGPLPWVTYILFVQNIWMTAKLNFGLSALGPTWSLAVEEQFYVTFPFLVRFLKRRRLAALSVAGILCAPVLRVLAFALWHSRFRYGAYVMMPCRADALLIGVLAAMALRDSDCRAFLQNNRGRLRYALLTLACGFIVLTKFSEWHSAVLVNSIGYTCLAIFYAVILLNAMMNRHSWIASCLRFRWLGWLGSISYSVYLFHQCIRQAFFALFLGGSPTVWTWQVVYASFLALGITLIWCQVSWTFFEKPFVRIGHNVGYNFRGELSPSAKK
jgi:peptidoglycan/LPS O-acetylase OafA/YrhL